MIVNVIRSKQEDILEALRDSEFEFYLTGSRFFKIHKEYSDWDFFVEENDEIHIYLSNYNFKNVSSETRYKDSETRSVWFHEEADVHVQIVKNAKLKEDAQILISKLPPLISIMAKANSIGDKSYCELIWNQAFDAVRILYSRWRYIASSVS
jgi:hypothetical protein